MPFHASRTTFFGVAALTALLAPVAAQPVITHPDSIIIQPGDIKWNGRPDSNKTVTLYGNNQGGKIISITDWVSGQISKPHYHQRDRTFIVLKGHWDFSTGPKDDVNALKDLPEGTAIHVPAGGIFKDGCKQAPCLILTVGESGFPSTYVDESGKDMPRAAAPTAPAAR